MRRSAIRSNYIVAGFSTLIPSQTNFRQLKQLGSLMQAKRKTGLTLFVQAGQDASKFLCAQPARDANQSRLSVLAYGETEASDGFSGIVSLLGEKKLKPRNLVLLLPRSAFEVNLFQLPDVEADDVPLMVSRGMPSLTFLHASAVAIQQAAAQEKSTYIYQFGDHDPSGVLIPRTIERRLDEMFVAYWGKETTMASFIKVIDLLMEAYRDWLG